MSRTSARWRFSVEMPGMPLADRRPVPLDDRQLDEFVQIEQACAQAIVDVVIVVGDVVGDRRDLCFEPRPGAELEIPLGVRFGHRPGRLAHRTVVLGESLERFPAEVEPVEVRIRSLEPGDDPDGVRVVVESAGIGERGVKRILAGMAERRMAEVVGEA